MAVFAVYIEKQTQYFGELRTFGNTYHYETEVAQPFDDEGVANQVAQLENDVTQSTVDFIRWKTWGPTDGAPLANVMRAEGELAFTGSAVASPGMYVEACALIVIEIGRSPVLNRRRWLRKFIRLPGYSGGVLAPDVISGRAPLPPAAQADFVTIGNLIKNIGIAGGGTVNLVTEGGSF